MKVLITGANGQVGQHLVQLLAPLFDVTAGDRELCDISDWQSVCATFETVAPDVVINAAAYTAVDLAEEQSELAYQINEQGSANLAKVAQQYGALLVHISTDYVFSGDTEGCYQESDSTEPKGVYGASKLAGELAVSKYHDKSIVIRTAWVFSEFGSNFVKTMLRVGSQRDQLGIVSDQFGGPTYAGDIAKVIKEIIVQYQRDEEFTYGVYHYSGYPHVSWHQFAEAVFEQAVEQNLIETMPVLNALTTEQYPTKAARPKNSRLDCAKICQQFSVEQSDWQFALNHLTSYVEK